MAHPSTEPLVLGVALVIVNLLTGIFSFIKESAAASLSRDIERLVPNNARVIRECIESVEPAEELVVGDILVRKYLLTQSSEIRALCLTITMLQHLQYYFTDSSNRRCCSCGLSYFGSN